MDNEKMSKSLGNIFTVRDILDKGYRGSSLRYLLISVHYRKQLTFNFEILDQADTALTRLTDFVNRVRAVGGDVAAPSSQVTERLTRARDEFRAHIASDLNVPGALGVLF